MTQTNKIEKLDYSKLADIEVDGINTRDYPDFCDAFISGGSYLQDDGTYRDLTDSELDELNENGDFVYSQVEKRLY